MRPPPSTLTARARCINWDAAQRGAISGPRPEPKDSAAVQYSSVKVGARRPLNAKPDPRSHRRAVARSASGGVRRRSLRRRVGRHRTSRAAGVRAAALSGARLHLGPWVLGVGRRPVLLGTRDLGARTGRRLSLDTRILGLGRRLLRLARGVLGSARRFLRWHQLRLRLLRPWL